MCPVWGFMQWPSTMWWYPFWRSNLILMHLNYHEFDFHTKISACIIKVSKSQKQVISSKKRTKSFLISALSCSQFAFVIFWPLEWLLFHEKCIKKGAYSERISTHCASIPRLEDVIISISTVGISMHSRSNLYVWCESMILNQIWASFLSSVKIVKMTKTVENIFHDHEYWINMSF